MALKAILNQTPDRRIQKLLVVLTGGKQGQRSVKEKEASGPTILVAEFKTSLVPAHPGLIRLVEYICFLTTHKNSLETRIIPILVDKSYS